MRVLIIPGQGQNRAAWKLCKIVTEAMRNTGGLVDVFDENSPEAVRIQEIANRDGEDS